VLFAQQQQQQQQQQHHHHHHHHQPPHQQQSSPADACRGRHNRQQHRLRFQLGAPAATAAACPLASLTLSTTAAKAVRARGGGGGGQQLPRCRLVAHVQPHQPAREFAAAARGLERHSWLPSNTRGVSCCCRHHRHTPTACSCCQSAPAEVSATAAYTCLAAALPHGASAHASLQACCCCASRTHSR
jgi:hypothetical protein